MTTEQIIWTLIINVISIIIGGGLIGLWIDWRRHQREIKQWELQDKLLEIDIPRKDILEHRWGVNKNMSADAKVKIYENELLGTVKGFVLVAQFVVRNTTPNEIVVTSYNVNVLPISGQESVKSFFDIDDYNLITPDEMETVTLKPAGTLLRLCVVQESFDEKNKLPEPPKRMSVEVTTSNGTVVQNEATLTEVQYEPADISMYKKNYLPIKYIKKIDPEWEEIPF